MPAVTNHYNPAKALIRMSWDPRNLYNLWQRSLGPLRDELKFHKSQSTINQQQMTCKRIVRGYHGDFLQENKFRRHWLPMGLPAIKGATLPDGSWNNAPLQTLMFSDLEKRLDVVIFRSNFAPSVYEARRLVVHGHVTLNGAIAKDANTKLRPGDIYGIDPKSVTYLKDNKPAPEPKLEVQDALDNPESMPEAPVKLPSKKSSLPPGVLQFKLPDYAAPSIFLPPYLEVSYRLMTGVYLRHPSAAPGRSEVPSPFDAEGEAMKLAWEYYCKVGRRRRVRTPRGRWQVDQKHVTQLKPE